MVTYCFHFLHLLKKETEVCYLDALQIGIQNIPNFLFV